MSLWLSYFKKKIESLEKIFIYIAGGTVIFIMLLVTFDVILRKLSIPLAGAHELVEVSFVGIVFLGLAYIQAEKGHIFIEIMTDKLPEKMKIILDIFGTFIGLFICFVITWQSGLQAWESLSMMEYAMGIVNIPIWPSRVAVTIGMGLLTIQILLDMINYFLSLINISQSKTNKE